MKKIIFIFLLVNCQVFSQNIMTIDSVYAKTQISSFSPEGIEYYKFPIGKMDSINFSVLVANSGLNVVENCKVLIQVTSNNNFFYNEFSDTFSMQPQSKDSIVFPLKFAVPETIGVYTVKYKLLSALNEFPSNQNIKYVDFEVTEKTLSRHNNLSDTTTDLMFDSNFGVGYTFEIEEEACLSSALVWTTANTFNQLVQLYAQLWEQDKVTGEFNLKTYSEINIPGFSGPLNPTQLDFHPYLLEPNKRYFIGVYNGGQSDTRIKYSQITNNNNSFKMIYDYSSIGVSYFNIEEADTNLIPMIDLKINSSIGCSNLLNNKEIVNELEPTVYPNPFRNQLSILLSDKVFKIEIYNSVGQIVYSKLNVIPLEVQIVNTEYLVDGLYFYQTKDRDGNQLNKGKIIKY